MGHDCLRWEHLGQLHRLRAGPRCFMVGWCSGLAHRLHSPCSPLVCNRRPSAPSMNQGVAALGSYRGHCLGRWWSLIVAQPVGIAQAASLRATVIKCRQRSLCPGCVLDPTREHHRTSNSAPATTTPPPPASPNPTPAAKKPTPTVTPPGTQSTTPTPWGYMVLETGWRRSEYFQRVQRRSEPLSDV